MADERDRSSDDMLKKQENQPAGGKDGSANKFANDGSFMEMFKQRMSEQKLNKDSLPSSSSGIRPDTDSSVDPDGAPGIVRDSEESAAAAPTSQEQVINKPKEHRPLPFVGKRRGAAPVLKTGAVKKAKQTVEEVPEKKDPWSQYLAEVKKYKEQSCQEENKTRPLVK